MTGNLRTRVVETGKMFTAEDAESAEGIGKKVLNGQWSSGWAGLVPSLRDVLHGSELPPVHFNCR